MAKEIRCDKCQKSFTQAYWQGSIIGVRECRSQDASRGLESEYDLCSACIGRLQQWLTTPYPQAAK